ncbi:hypothetical protein AAG570_012782 [Ranatra chinensis]|uniref:Major facilitator superfamily domain-containing protein 12 n=1 Tax=Ranatra chinensis TaxID=642074 RepID=A0ABD0YXB6_9HEMI
MWFTYGLLFYNYVVGFSGVNSGAIILVGQVADALSTPVVGLLSDRGQSCWALKYGKRKTWHLIGTICVIGTTPFMYSPCIGCTHEKEWKQLIYYCVFVAIFQFGWASVQISHLSLAPDLTPDENERTSLLSIRYSFTVLSNLAVYLVTWLVLEIGSSNNESQLSSSDTMKFQEIAYTICGVGAITSIAFHATVKERNPQEPLLEGENIPETTPRLSLKQIFSRLQLYQVACVYMATRLFSNISQSLIPLYLHDYLRLGAQSLAIVPFVMFLSSFLTSLIIRLLNTYLGRKVFTH